MSERVTRRLAIHGRVQGVGFRESMRREAERIGVTGWVANRADGSVEAIVQGTAHQVAEITRWARSGPEESQVTEVASSEASGEFRAFEKRASY
ncbi:MAG: acylphosphatase [Usitatibacter sp.]